MIVVKAQGLGVHWFVERPGVPRVLLAEQFPQQLIAILERLTELSLRLGVVQPVWFLDGGPGLSPGPDPLDSLCGWKAGGERPSSDTRQLLYFPLGSLQRATL